MLPRPLALEMLWLAAPIQPERLQALGLVNRVTDKGQALVEALDLATRLAAMAPNAVAAAKELVARAALSPLSEHLEAERQHFIANLFHENGGEGLKAFFEKRPAVFR
jgi:enoyl-CoA hydratase/carnithine racemase